MELSIQERLKDGNHNMQNKLEFNYLILKNH